MSELRPDSPVQRPVTARPRAEAVPEVDPPTAEELAAIQRHVVTRPAQEGATISVDDELGVTFVRGPGNGPDANYAAMPRWGADDWARSLAAMSERMRADGTWPSLMLFDRLDRPAGLDSQLENGDWVRAISETIMWVGHASVVPHLDPSLRIEAVQSRHIDRYEALERGIFGLGADQAERRRATLGAALDTGDIRAWIVWLEDEAVAVARLSQGDGVAGIQGVGVIESRRGQGFATLITTIATRAGMAVGNRLIWLSVDEENPAAMKVYTNLGFKPIFRWARWLATEDPRRR